MAIVASIKDTPHVCQPGCPDWPADDDQAAPTVEREQMFHWSPSSSLIGTLLKAAFAGAAILGLLGFALSFRSVAASASHDLHGWSFVLPVIIDLGIAVLTMLSLVLALAGMPSRLINLVPTGLSAYTLYLNCADQPGIYSKLVHGAGPLMWIVVVEAGGLVVRRLAGLENAKPSIERLRWSLWILRPVPTFRLWRQMRVHQIRTYRGVLDRDAARRVVKGRMRLHYGRTWRTRAPLGERIALRLQGQGAEGVREELTAHQSIAALLADAPQDAPEPFIEPEPELIAPTAPAAAQPATAPAPAPRPAASPSTPRAPRTQTPGAGKVRSVQTHTDAELVDLAEAAERAALAASGGASGLSYRAAMAALHVGAPKAKEALDAARERIAAAAIPTVVIPAPAAPVAVANGSSAVI